MTKKIPRLFSIPHGEDFLSHFVKCLKAGDLLPEAAALPLSDYLIYVPTRRAARALRSAFIDISPNKTSLLPTIRPLGESEDETMLFFEGMEPPPLYPAPIGTIERLILLATFIQPWRKNLHLPPSNYATPTPRPFDTADALWLAQDLATLLDMVENEAADWDNLQAIIPEQLADWWQITLSFLTIIRQAYPKVLEEKQKSSKAALRNQLLRAHAQHLNQTSTARPILAIGTVASLPAVIELLSAIARLPNGAIVLPGLDFNMDEESWLHLDKEAEDASVFGHPQYHLKKFLNKIGSPREHVINLDSLCTRKKQRAALISETFRPAQTSEKWAHRNKDHDAAIIEDLAIIEAANEREEALAIACALRQAILPPDKTAALITADRQLVRRVISELERFGIHADDSSGQPLAHTPPATLARLILQVFFNPSDSVAFLSLLKHPLTALGHERAKIRHLAENFELFALRGGTGRVEINQCDEFIKARLIAMSRAQYPEDAWQLKHIQEAEFLAKYLAQAVAPLQSLRHQGGAFTIAQVAKATVETLETFARLPDGSLDKLYEKEAGVAIATFLRDLVEAPGGLDPNTAKFTFPLDDWPRMFDALLSTVFITPKAGGHPRLFIWAPLDSRLQTVDTAVLAGLNEGGWPTKGQSDPFLSRPMKTVLNLPPPEQTIGRSAHDFQALMGMDKVILSRSLRAEQAPTVASRWLQRLETVLGVEQSARIRARGQQYLHWARALDQAPDKDKNLALTIRPNPMPPLAVRPKHFSVTEIDTLRRDPYAIYAKHILKLKPLKPLIHDASFAERGTLYHAIIAGFSQSNTDAYAADALQTFLSIARAEFDMLALPAEIEALWWPRLTLLAPRFLEWEKSLGSRKRWPEIKSRAFPIGDTGVTLSARADRIDILPNNYADIIDFKTGTSPTAQQASSLQAPQLALEAALFMRGAFNECPNAKLEQLLYIRLNNRGEVKPEPIIDKEKQNVKNLADKAWQQLENLIRAYQKPQQGYLSRALPSLYSYESDYDHLARLLEWSIGFEANETAANDA
ncbi:double-strand break repair protein AddB [Bartonella sp. DGB2]|uniref:double-strand break repair protein AddB n=1 Tax=Bartonella sp. DGB2 TaxID=3388426 RepID=UPI00398FD9E9